MPCAELLNSAHELEQGEARFGSIGTAAIER
jgi:hypothetical protein